MTVFDALGNVKAFDPKSPPPAPLPTKRNQPSRLGLPCGKREPTRVSLRKRWPTWPGIERSHMGKIERGEHVPTLPLILKIARALKCSSAHLMT